MIGDCGDSNATTVTLGRLSNLVNEGFNGQQINFIIHNGDLSYGDGRQDVSDTWNNLMSNIARYVPYMMTPGNHEMAITPLLGIWEYPERYFMPNVSKQLYYSFNYGLAHFVGLDGEGLEDEAYVDEDQLEWLRNDLSVANSNRDEQPWIIVYLHRPLYCSSNNLPDCGIFAEALRLWLEDIFMQYKVDLVLTSHRHNYERSWPLYRSKIFSRNYVSPAAPVYIVNGAGGNREGQVSFGPVQPNWSAVRLLAVGYGMLQIKSSEQLVWQFYASYNNTMLDSFQITKVSSKH